MFHIQLRYARLGFVCLVACAWGCSRTEEFTQYTVPKQPPRSEKAAARAAESHKVDNASDLGQGRTFGLGTPIETPPTVQASEGSGANVDPATGPDRMLGAIIVRGAQLWFFKLTGPEAIVSGFQPAFVDFVRTVRFTGADDSPTWQAPQDWSEDRTRAMRLATLQFEVDGTPLEIAITSLPNRGGDVDAALQANIDRWLGQVGLPRMPLVSLRKDAARFQTVAVADGVEATVVNFRGKLTANSMAPPFAR